MGALDDLLAKAKPAAPPSALDALLAKSKPAAPAAAAPAPQPTGAVSPPAAKPTVPTPEGQIAPDNPNYKPPGLIDQAKDMASGAASNLAGNIQQESQAGTKQFSEGRQQVADAFNPKDGDRGFMAGMKRDVTQLLPGLGKMLMGGARSAAAPMTGAFQSEADLLTNMTGNKDFGERVSDVTGLFGGNEMGGAARAMAGMSAEEKATSFIKAIDRGEPLPKAPEATESSQAPKAGGTGPQPLAQAKQPSVSAPPPGKARMAPRGGPVNPQMQASAQATAQQVKQALGGGTPPGGKPPSLPTGGAAAAAGNTGTGVAVGDARGLIRQKVGEAERASHTSAAALEPFQAKINSLNPQETQEFLDYVEGRSTGATLKDPTLQPVADTLRTAFKEREAALASSNPTAKMNFIEDYFPHMWQDPKAAQNFLAQWGTGGKQGSGAATKARSLPTIADGLAAGLKLKYANPLEAATMYTANMDRYIALNEVIDTAKSEGTVKYLSPGKQPAGWAQVNGRLGQKSTPAGPKIAYAPADWARDYNNFVSRGWHDIDPKLGDLMANLRKASNAVTFAELSFSGFHLATMASEAVTSAVAKAVGEAAGLRPDKAIASLIKAPFEPITRAVTGRKAQQVYLGLTPGTQQEKDLVDLLTQANMRMTGMDKTLRQTAAGSFFTAWRRGALKMQMMEDLKSVKGPISAVTTAAKQLGRVAETIQQPIFEKYIPMLKNGAAMDQLKSWLAMNPAATQEQKLTAARKIVDSVDNRFGEMVQDNLFINQTLKQTAQIMMRSYSWNLGTLREIGGGGADILKTGGRALLPGSEKWSPRASYVLALPLATSFMNAVYQYLKTHKPPQDMHDLIAPRTGGTDAATGQPERATLPSYMKDVYGWYENGPIGEAYNKLATAPRAAYEVMANKDWRGDPIRGPDPHQWLQNYLDYVVNTFGPISPKTLAKGEKKGSALTTPEAAMGVRPAPRYMTAPDQFGRMMDNIHGKQWRLKQKHDRKTQSQYGGTQ